MKIKKIFFFLINIVLLTFIFEYSLRILTPFPLNDGSNTIQDNNLSYKMKVNTNKEIDKMGFRNEKDKHKNYDIAAIGDSHTYGWNNTPFNSWPQVVERKTNKIIYNFGVGSYNIYQFFYLAVENIKKEKLIILQVGPTQDFVNYHQFSKNSDFWVQNNKIFELNIFTNILKRNDESALNTFQKFKKFSRNNIAIINIFDHYVWNNFLKKKKFSQEDSINLGEELGFVKKIRVDSIYHNTNFKNPHIIKNIENFEKFLIFFEKNYEKKIMFSIFPTRERIFYEYLNDRNVEIDLYFEKVIKNEIKFENFIIGLIKKYNFDVVNSANYILKEFKKSKNKREFYPDDDHPNTLGYSMIAESILKNGSFFEN